jgi:hypothetical protein
LYQYFQALKEKRFSVQRPGMTSNDAVDAQRHTLLRLPLHVRDCITTGFGSFTSEENPLLSLDKRMGGLAARTFGPFQLPSHAGKQ